MKNIPTQALPNRKLITDIVEHVFCEVLQAAAASIGANYAELSARSGENLDDFLPPFVMQIVASYVTPVAF